MDSLFGYICIYICVCSSLILFYYVDRVPLFSYWIARNCWGQRLVGDEIKSRYCGSIIDLVDVLMSRSERNIVSFFVFYVAIQFMYFWRKEKNRRWWFDWSNLIDDRKGTTRDVCPFQFVILVDLVLTGSLIHFNLKLKQYSEMNQAAICNQGLTFLLQVGNLICKTAIPFDYQMIGWIFVMF